MSVHPSIFIEIGKGVGSNSPIGIHGYYNNQTTNEEQMKMMLKLMETITTLNDRLNNVLEQNGKSK